MFLIVALHNFGFRLPQIPKLKINFKLISPLPQKVDVFDNILPKLENKRTNYQLKDDTSLIQQSFASGELLADNANAYIVLDYDTGKIIAEKNSNDKYPIASLTKIMTAVTALDLASPDELFTIKQAASNVEPTRIGVDPGEKISLNDLLNGALLMSGNDAAEAIRDGIDAKYNDNIFIRAMNEKANFLGLTNSHFSNPMGFDYGENISSAHDVAVMTQYALSKYPLINSIVKKDRLDIPATNTHKEFDLINWNGLIGVYPETQGVKIGFTGKAGTTTVVLSNRDNKRILVVLLGAPGILERDFWAAQLLDLGYQKEYGLDPVNITEDDLHAKYSGWYN